MNQMISTRMKQMKKKLLYVSDISVSIEGSYLILLDRASIPVERFEPTFKGKP